MPQDNSGYLTFCSDQTVCPIILLFWTISMYNYGFNEWRFWGFFWRYKVKANGFKLSTIPIMFQMGPLHTTVGHWQGKDSSVVRTIFNLNFERVKKLSQIVEFIKLLKFNLLNEQDQNFQLKISWNIIPLIEHVLIDFFKGDPKKANKV